MSKKWVYLFKEVEEAEACSGSWDDTLGLLGGKGAKLADMTRLGLPVPPGFTITTEACNAYLEAGEQFPQGAWDQILAALRTTEEATGKELGNASNPLLVSCRSGGKFSMPGMMDTVLNIGLNDETARGMVNLTGDEAFVYDSYRRLVQMFGSVVLGVPDEEFEDAIEERKEEKSVEEDTELEAEDWKALTQKFKAIIRKHKGLDFPQDTLEQLKLAVEAVFKSWNGAPAIAYRNRDNIPHDLGTGVNVQTMAFGNLGWTSGSGVAFTRNAATGDRELYGEYLLNAQGEDVVSGKRNANKIAELAEEMPEVYAQFVAICDKLEQHYREAQDIEFTIERGKLWMLQTRDGKRTAKAAVKIAVDMVDEGLITREEALQRVKPDQVGILLHPQFDLKAKDQAREEGRYLTGGVNASPGAAVGMVAFDADLAEEWGKAGKDVIMVRPETKPDDVHGMQKSKGILTSRGGATSHAAVVARQYGTPAVVGCKEIRINLDARHMEVKGQIVKEGEWLSVDGTAGEVFVGQITTEKPRFEEQTELITLLEWADEICTREGTRAWPEDCEGFPTKGLQVWTNADKPDDARRARSLGARGIGLARTEHMFFDHLPIVQAMILADSAEERQAHLDKLLPLQRADFEGLFEAMDGLPVIIRLIDPPLHEFLPDRDELIEKVARMEIKVKRYKKKGKKKKRARLQAKLSEKEELLQSIKDMKESNPMMGLRGIRLGITIPEITQMQVRAIFEAACHKAKEGIDVHPEIMIPLTGHYNELRLANQLLVPVAQEVMAEMGIEVDYKFGTMIEVPRAAVTADEIAQHAQFFSFGTNDLAQMTFGYSRDDAEGKFLLTYIEGIDTGEVDAEGKPAPFKILPENPFQTLDRNGVGKLVEWAVQKGREIRPKLEVGICGEHGGDASSIEFCHIAGLNYVSCDPFRVPEARLAAAQATLKHRP